MRGIRFGYFRTHFHKQFRRCGNFPAQDKFFFRTKGSSGQKRKSTRSEQPNDSGFSRFPPPPPTADYSSLLAIEGYTYAPGICVIHDSILHLGSLLLIAAINVNHRV
ncbi:hypothetical protein TNCV_563171 [Trichonephila clavipes]|nr:hypothetical protein TNCV_563171 [Trichonephila clavipes]